MPKNNAFSHLKMKSHSHVSLHTQEEAWTKLMTLHITYSS